MVMGHYATALIPYAYRENRSLAPFWVFLLATQMLDFIMLALVMIGVEEIAPANFFAASFRSMVVDMTYSHDIAPVIAWSLLFTVITLIAFKSTKLALIVLGLTVLHELMDLLVGFKHYWFGMPEQQDAAAFGFGLYTSAPVTGILIELAICIGLLIWYFRRRATDGAPVLQRSKVTLAAVLVGFTAFLLLIANQSMIELVS
ncbi:MAG: hypothetical protein AB8B86_14300 [Pseudomonadales bacterium]